METLEPIITIKDLSIGFQRPLMSSHLNLVIPKGKFTAVIGRNGIGKSTLLSVLCGGEGIIKGEVFIASETVSLHKLPAHRLAELVAYVPQEHLFPSHFRAIDLLGMSLLHRVGLWGKLPSSTSKEIVDLAKRLRFDALLEKPLGEMSSGERQRVFLGRALLQKSKLLILDEPTNHLDPCGVREFWETVSAYAKGEGLSILMSTHDLNFLEKFADDVLALGREGIVFYGGKEKYLREKIAEKIF